jgi:DNA-binding CsgD family transcriptional regulator
VVTLEHFYETCAMGRHADIAALLGRFPASARIRDPIAIALRGMKAVTGGDMPGGLALLKRAAAHCEGRVRQYILDLLIPAMVNTNGIDEASLLLETAGDVADELVPAFLSMRAIVAARQGADAASEAYAREALEAGRGMDNGSIRGRLLANPLNQQFYRTRLNYVISEALSYGWAGHFEMARASLTSLRQTDELSLPERSLCDALLAVIALTTWQLDLARSLARRAISQTSERAGKEPLFDARRRRIARILAATVCIIVGDTTRGRRALSRAVDPEQRFASMVSPLGMDEERTPALMRGYARFINQACASASLVRPRYALTDAELEILKALPEGMTLATIASSLGKSKKTVEKQVGSIYSKLEVGNRAEAVRRARDLGIYA